GAAEIASRGARREAAARPADLPGGAGAAREPATAASLILRLRSRGGPALAATQFVQFGKRGSASLVLLDQRPEGLLVADRVEPRVRKQAFDRPAAGGRQVPIELGDGEVDRVSRHEHLAREP